LHSLPRSGEGFRPSPATSPLESAPKTKGSRTPDLSGEGHVRWLHHNNTHPTRPNRSNRCHGWSTPGISSKPVPLPAHDGRHHRRTHGWTT
ncbi:hypothetical protein V3C99_016118, partial [Haemonchus contortus]